MNNDDTALAPATDVTGPGMQAMCEVYAGCAPAADPVTRERLERTMLAVAIAAYPEAAEAMLMRLPRPLRAGGTHLHGPGCPVCGRLPADQGSPAAYRRDHGVTESRVRRLVALIAERHHQPDLTVSGLAAASGDTIDRLAIACRLHLGLTPNTVRRDVRLHVARCSLGVALCGSVRVSAVAAAAGLPEKTHFAVIYRRRYGQSPSQTLARPPEPLYLLGDVHGLHYTAGPTPIVCPSAVVDDAVRAVVSAVVPENALPQDLPGRRSGCR